MVEVDVTEKPPASEYQTAVAFGVVVTTSISAALAAKAAVLVSLTLQILVPFPVAEICEQEACVPGMVPAVARQDVLPTIIDAGIWVLFVRSLNPSTMVPVIVPPLVMAELNEILY